MGIRPSREALVEKSLPAVGDSERLRYLIHDPPNNGQRTLHCVHCTCASEVVTGGFCGKCGWYACVKCGCIVDDSFTCKDCVYGD